MNLKNCMKENLNTGDKKMNDEDIKKIINDTYDVSKEDAYLSMTRLCFNKKLRWTAVIVVVHFLFFAALSVVFAYLFWQSNQSKFQIMYAALFICSFLIAYLIKVFAWVMSSKHMVEREIKRLELRIVELAETVKGK